VTRFNKSVLFYQKKAQFKKKRHTNFLNSSPLTAKNVDIRNNLTQYSANCQYLTVCAVSFIPLTALPLFFLPEFAKNLDLCGIKKVLAVFMPLMPKLRIRAPPFR